MVLSINSFATAAKLGGDLNVVGKGDNARIVNSNTNWLGRAVSWVKSLFAGEAEKKAQQTMITGSNKRFLQVLKEEYGSDLGKSIAQQFGISETSSKPLSARTVKQAIKTANDKRQLNASINRHAVDVRLAPGTDGFQRLGETIDRNFNAGKLTNAQNKLYERMLGDEIDSMSNGHSKMLTVEDQNKAAKKVLADVLALGTEAAQKAHSLSNEATENLRNLVKSVFDNKGTDAAEKLLTATIQLEKLGNVQKVDFSLPATQLALARPIVTEALGNELKDVRELTPEQRAAQLKEKLSKLRDAMLDPKGILQAMVQAMPSDSGRARELGHAATSVLKVMLEEAGRKLELSQGERQNDMNRFVAGSPTPSEHVASLGAHIAKLIPRSYDTDTRSLWNLALDGHKEAIFEITAIAEKDQSEELGEFFKAISTVKTFDELHDIVSNITATMSGKDRVNSNYKSTVTLKDINLSQWEAEKLKKDIEDINKDIDDPKQALAQMKRAVTDKVLSQYGHVIQTYFQNAEKAREMRRQLGLV